MKYRSFEGMSGSDQDSVVSRRELAEARFAEAGRWRDFLTMIDGLWAEDQSPGTVQVRAALTEFTVERMDSLLGVPQATPAHLTESDVVEVVENVFRDIFPFDGRQVNGLREIANRYIERADHEDLNVKTRSAPAQRQQPPRRPTRPSQETVEPEHVPVKIPLPRGAAFEALMDARARQDSQAGLRGMADRQRNADSGSQHDLG